MNKTAKHNKYQRMKVNWRIFQTRHSCGGEESEEAVVYINYNIIYISRYFSQFIHLFSNSFDEAQNTFLDIHSDTFANDIVANMRKCVLVQHVVLFQTHVLYSLFLCYLI